ncbi:MAG TPA: hypothetical protein VGR04_09425 [Acidimicrobiia bacterium]|jgi:hypothetical protein|nr:hypothetical protein [Acidimicrobiia bacterium]
MPARANAPGRQPCRGPDGAINEIDPATIQIGDPVRVVFHRVEDVVLPRWMKT